MATDSGSFVNDLERWKTVLPVDQHGLFAELAFQLWSCSSIENPSTDSQEALLQFQTTVLKLNATETRNDTSKASSPFARGDPVPTPTLPSSLLAAGPQVVSSYDQSGMDMEGIIYSPSFIATGQLEQLPGSSSNWFPGPYMFPSNIAGPSQQDSSMWNTPVNSFSPVLLLGSVAFACVMNVVLGRFGADPFS